MLSKFTQSISSTVLLSFISLSHLTSAALSLQALQPIANFPVACQNAYQALIQPCPDANSFSLSASNSGSSICSKECYLALSKATASIQKACQGSSAPPGTVIAHAFSGDLPLWLCTMGSGSGTQPSSNNNPSSTVPSLTSVASTANPTANPTSTASNSASTTKTSASTDSLSNSGSESATKTPNLGSSTSSSSSSQSNSTPSSNRPSEATSQATSAPATSSSSSRSEPTLKPGGGGSPFDQVVPNVCSLHEQNMWSIAIGLAVVAMLGI